MKIKFARVSWALAAILVAASAAAGTYRLAPPKPAENSTVYSPIAGGHTSDPTYAKNASGVKLYKVDSTSIGMIASEKGGDLCVGDALTAPDDIAVDWATFSLSLTNQAAYKEGYVFYTESTNEAERIIVARPGTFELVWTDRDGKTTKTSYETGLKPTVVPHRLFWTSAPFNAPSVTLSKNYGVKVFGDPALFWNETHTNKYGAADYDYGVHYNYENNVCQAYAKQLADGTWTGPVGTIVVAYYDSGSYEHYLGCTVVQVSGLDPVYLTSAVGNELRPQNEHYDPESSTYQPVVQSSQNQTDDPRAPYVYVQKRVAGQYHAKENRVFAISETLDGEAGAKKAEVFWEAADGFDVFWPFEETCYHIKWPDCPVVVLGREKSGPGVTIPSIYTPSLLDWQDPSGVARVDSSTLVLNGEGRFTLKLTNEKQDDFWLLPMGVAYSDNEEEFSIATVSSVAVGAEIRPQVAAASRTTKGAKLLASLDDKLPGYLYSPNSLGANWNPNLYRDSETVDDSANPFSTLVSSLYFVNVTTRTYDAEVWWLRSYSKDGMAEALTMPVLPQRVKAAWPGREEAASVVFASGLGSGAGGRVGGGTGIFLAEGAAKGSTEYVMEPGDDCTFTMSFAYNPSPVAAVPYDVKRTTGELLSFDFGVAALTFDVTNVSESAVSCLLRLGGETVATLACPSNHWTTFAVVAETNDLRVYADYLLLKRMTLPLPGTAADNRCVVRVGARSGESSAAAGAALDDIYAWNMALPDDVILAGATNDLAFVTRQAVLQLAFDKVRYDGGTLYVQDDGSRRYFEGTGFKLLSPGAPVWEDGLFGSADGISPRAYVQNDIEKSGYKPNIEHAIALASSDGRSSLYALRTDMNTSSTPPYVLVEYAADGKGAMRAYRVAMTNEWYHWPTLFCTAGQKVSNFPPYPLLPSGLSPETENGTEANTDDSAVTYRDRGGAWWARRDGIFNQFMRYVGEEGFVAAAGTDRSLAGITLPAANLTNCYAWAAEDRVQLKNEGLQPKVVFAEAESAEADAVVSAESDGEKIEKGSPEWLLAQSITPIGQKSSWPEGSVPVMSIAQVLSKPESGLPDVYDMKTCAVAYPFWGYHDERTGEKYHPANAASNRVVKLVDPTRRKEQTIDVASSFPDEYGFTLGSTGNLVNRKGYYYFQEMPPNVSDRLFVDITSAGTGKAHLCLKGDYIDDGAGTSYLRANSLSKEELKGITNVFAKILAASTDAKVKAKLKDLIDKTVAFNTDGDFQPSRQTGYKTMEVTYTQGNAVTNDTFVLATNSYEAADHYALMATGEGSGYVTLIENDGPSAGSLPVSMHVIYVTTNLYRGKIVAVTDTNNKLSEQLNLLYTAPLGKTADDFTFEWYALDAPEDGQKPTVPESPSVTPGGLWPSTARKTGEGLACIDAVANANSAQVSMKDLVNRYWTMHYKAKANTTAEKVTGGRWSNWCSPMLAEGWIQRVLNSITPFAQRLSDLSSNKAELKYTMPEQIGAPWEGDVALNNENLNNVGLVQLYQTILNRAESMSIAQGAGTTADDTNAAVNKQLIECVARLADMHMTLGAEAYSDAQNPLIASSDGTEFAGSVFCFANQVPSLLDEELALLRGRTKGVAPDLTESPFYNRLMWNFTKGVTQGEVAYVNNYNISAVDGVLDASAAAAMYPQGHGDAYGYYLSALKGYYRLLRNPNFQWGQASMMEMLVANHVVNMDYQEEDKFAECAYNLAKIGAEVVNLTARKQWRDSDGDILSAYFDDPTTCLTVTTTTLPQAFGTGEWACRAGYGALCNWAVANSILPPSTNEATIYFKDQTISTVTRKTSTSLSPLATALSTIESTLNAVDAGVNPLGLSENAIPFDISPADFRGSATGQDAKSHYEQIRERADVALKNAKTVLDYANIYGSRLRAIENEEFDANADAAEMEASYDRQLVAIYGRPFSDDIGPGKTYEQGYTGPDLYHYMYMNLAEYGLDTVASMTDAVVICSLSYDAANTFTEGHVENKELTVAASTNEIAKLLALSTGKTMSFSLTADGFVAMPTGWVGTRACEGSIQAAYRTFLSAYVQAKTAQETYESTLKAWNWQVQSAAETYRQDTILYSKLKSSYETQKKLEKTISILNSFGTSLSAVMDLFSKSYGFTAANQQDAIVGVAYSIPLATAFKTAFGSAAAGVYSVSGLFKKALDIVVINEEYSKAAESLQSQIDQLTYSDYSNRKAVIEALRSANTSLYTAGSSLKSAYASLLAAQQSYRTIAEEGTALLEARTLARTKLVNVATQRRYADMYARIARNTALSKFSTTFDVAQRYVFELAKVYDYETGLDVSDSASGKAFVNATVATRALGTESVSIDSSVTDGGLWDLVNRMDKNFAQLKGRLGINNPDISTKWFSLRYSNYRINEGAANDAAWRQKMESCWVKDIIKDSRFAAHCQPPVRADGKAAGEEPGFIFEFSTSINLAENFFGNVLQGGESAYSSSDYAVKVYAAGVDFSGYTNATTVSGGLACEPNIYLVPIGKDYMRAPLAASRKTIGFTVVDQVLPLPYDVGEDDLASTDWVATLNGFDGTADSSVKIRRHSTLRMGPVTSSTRLVGRSVWNDKWILVIPAAEMNANAETAKEKFLTFVKDIKLGIQAYSRSGN